MSKTNFCLMAVWIAALISEGRVRAAAATSLGEVEALPPLPQASSRMPDFDWLVTPAKQRAGIYRGNASNEIVMNNGLISRTWRLSPNAATVAFDNLMTDQ